jgi:hypothetical protein
VILGNLAKFDTLASHAGVTSEPRFVFSFVPALGVRVFENFDPGLENFDHFAPF